MQSSFVTVLQPNDVIMGRGAPTIQYKGNIMFRELISTRKVEYMKAGRHRIKRDIARQILDEINRRGGRFLRKVDNRAEARALGVPPGEHAWVVANEAEVIEKVKQALRDRDVISNDTQSFPADAAMTDSNESDHFITENSSFSFSDPLSVIRMAAAGSNPTSLTSQQEQILQTVALLIEQQVLEQARLLDLVSLQNAVYAQQHYHVEQRHISDESQLQIQQALSALEHQRQLNNTSYDQQYQNQQVVQQMQQLTPIHYQTLALAGSTHQRGSYLPGLQESFVQHTSPYNSAVDRADAAISNQLATLAALENEILLSRQSAQMMMQHTPPLGSLLGATSDVRNSLGQSVIPSSTTYIPLSASTQEPNLSQFRSMSNTNPSVARAPWSTVPLAADPEAAFPSWFTNRSTANASTNLTHDPFWTDTAPIALPQPTAAFNDEDRKLPGRETETKSKP